MSYKNLTHTFAQTNCSQPAVIFGLGREGWSTYQFLRTTLPQLAITLVDDQPLESLAPHWQEAAAHDQTTFSQSTQVSLPKHAIIYKTPGIPPSHPLLNQAATQQLRHSCNTQVVLEFVKYANTQLSQTQTQPLQTIGITGTKGKSTTSALVAAALSQSQFAPVLGGNIGRPPLDLLPELDTLPPNKQPVLVLELSSHQLSDLTLSPHIAIIQEIVPEHLDYYPTVWHYVAAKTGISRWQENTDIVITSTEFALPLALANLSPGKHLTFQVAEPTATPTAVPPQLRELLPTLPEVIPAPPEPRVRNAAGQLQIDTQSVTLLENVQTQLKLLGEHNLYNLLAAITAAVALDVPAQQILAGLEVFTPLPHRLQLVAEKNGVRYVNDSLATTPEAAAAAIASFSDSPVILIAGGHDRHLDFAELADALVRHRVKGLILFPPTGELISETLHKRHPGSALSETQFKVQSMPEAVHIAAQLAKPGDVVLLSPASASFGTFRDYQDRGEQFAQAINEL